MLGLTSTSSFGLNSLIRAVALLKLLNKNQESNDVLLRCMNYFRIFRMIKSLVWNKSSGWTLVLGLVLNLLADPAGVGEHQRRESVRKI